MVNTFELVIVIPVYNEAKRLPISKYQSFLKKHPQVCLCFVNDGSTDGTDEVLHDIASGTIDQVLTIGYSKNKGKAGAVLAGFQYCETVLAYQKIAYLDADLATSLEACYEMSQKLNDVTAFVFGSRIRKLDSFIKRKAYRFYIGRCVATMISKQLKLYVYDTQCGCKIFNKALASSIFQEAFVSTWLFDVELFHRIQNLYGKRTLIRISKEVPLRSWIDKNDSKVSFTYVFKMWLELIMIRQRYTSKKLKHETIVLHESAV